MKGLVMFSNKKRIADLKDEINELKAELSETRKENLTLSLENKQIKNQDEKEVRDADLVINFEAIPVVSLERYVDKYNVLITGMSYLIDSGENKQEVRESVFYCSQEKHEELIKEFREHIKKHDYK